MERARADELDWTAYDHGEMAFRRKELSSEATADRADDEDIGCSLYELPPGKRSWPYHYHTGNAEAIYVLDGSGLVRTDGDPEAIEAGDYVAFPPDERGSHQLVNDGDEPLRYLAVSTMNEPDVTVYPEMNKVGVFTGSPPGGRSERGVGGYWDLDDDVGYWED
jgi:uncharacterized cupin superfamily protein